MTVRRRIAVLISGRGSNMASLIAASRAPDFPAEIAFVLANKASAAGLDTARGHGIQTAVVDHRPFAGDRAAFDREIDRHLRAQGIDFVCLAGFMRILSPEFVEGWAGRMINIHPSLLPSFPGLDTHARAIAAGVRVHGCTVHFVTGELDAGPIIAQATVPIRFGDTPETLADRVLGLEHRLYPAALALIASGRAHLDGDRVVFADEAAARAALIACDT